MLPIKALVGCFERHRRQIDSRARSTLELNNPGHLHPDSGYSWSRSPTDRTPDQSRSPRQHLVEDGPGHKRPPRDRSCRRKHLGGLAPGDTARIHRPLFLSSLRFRVRRRSIIGVLASASKMSFAERSRSTAPPRALRERPRPGRWPVPPPRRLGAVGIRTVLPQGSGQEAWDQEVRPTLMYTSVANRQEIGVRMREPRHDSYEFFVLLAHGRRPEPTAVHDPEIQIVPGRNLDDGEGVRPMLKTTRS